MKLSGFHVLDTDIAAITLAVVSGACPFKLDILTEQQLLSVESL
jgi:hypothetical protein